MSKLLAILKAILKKIRGNFVGKIMKSQAEHRGIFGL
jgi:hypothetical protein